MKAVDRVVGSEARLVVTTDGRILKDNIGLKPEQIIVVNSKETNQ